MDRPRLRRKAPLAGVAALLVAAACGDDPEVILPEDMEPPRVVLGTLHAPGTTAFQGLTARVRWGTREWSSPVNTDGSFAVPVQGEVEGFGQLTIEPSAAAGLGPAWVLLSPGDLDQMGRLALLPTTWTIESGDYAGTVVSIRPDRATDTRVLPSFWGAFFPFRQDGFLQTILDPKEWTGAFSSWSDADLPIPVAFDRPGSDAGFSPADSAAFWSHVAAMESAFGKDLFRPARLSDLNILGGVRRADGGLLVQLDSLLRSQGLGNLDNADGRAWTLTADARSWSGGPVERVGFISEDITGARVAFHDAGVLAQRGVVIHELMHILGAGHGCSWPSVQTYCESLRRDVPTAEDVAHMEVLAEARRLEKQVRTRWGLFSAVTGARVVTLKQPPVPSPALVFGPAN